MLKKGEIDVCPLIELQAHYRVSNRVPLDLRDFSVIKKIVCTSHIRLQKHACSSHKLAEISKVVQDFTILSERVLKSTKPRKRENKCMVCSLIEDVSVES